MPPLEHQTKQDQGNAATWTDMGMLADAWRSGNLGEGAVDSMAGRGPPGFEMQGDRVPGGLSIQLNRRGAPSMVSPKQISEPVNVFRGSSAPPARHITTCHN